jgi:tetratricopeptide (TPR) repeat protein
MPRIRRRVLIAIAVVGAIAGCGKSAPKPDLATLLGAGTSAEQQGRLDDAEQLFIQAEQLDPNSATAHFDLGQVAQAQNRDAAALAEYNIAIRLDPTFVRPRYNAATIYSTTDPQRAIAGYEQVVQLDPKNAAAYLNLGLIQIQQNQPADVATNLRRAVHLDPAYAARIPKAYRSQVLGKTAARTSNGR